MKTKSKILIITLGVSLFASSCGDGATTTASCLRNYHYLFTTSNTYTGDLGGLAGADAKCQSEAEAASVCGTFKAVLSDSTHEVKDRLVFRSGYPLKTFQTDGTEVIFLADAADAWTASWQLLVPPNITASGSTLPGSPEYVWTASQTDGSTSGVTNFCQDWTSSNNGDSADIVGDAAQTSGDSIKVGGDTCDKTFRLYCVSQ